MTARSIRRCALFLFVTMLSLSHAQRASAQGFISPLIGYNFGGDSGCPAITNCDDKHINWGVALGALGPIVGFEAEIAHTGDFFGQTPNQSTSVLTFMANFMLAPKIGPVQPYGVIGLGLMKTSVEGVSTGDENAFAYDLGGGLIIFFSRHVGIRGDIRYFHSLEISDLFSGNGIFPNFGETKLDFGRAAAALMLKF